MSGVADQSDTKSHISLVCYCKNPHHTQGHASTPPHPFLTHTHTFAQLHLLQISHTSVTTTELYKPFIVMHVIAWDSR